MVIDLVLLKKMLEFFHLVFNPLIALNSLKKLISVHHQSSLNNIRHEYCAYCHKGEILGQEGQLWLTFLSSILSYLLLEIIINLQLWVKEAALQR